MPPRTGALLRASAPFATRSEGDGQRAGGQAEASKVAGHPSSDILCPDKTNLRDPRTSGCELFHTHPTIAGGDSQWFDRRGRAATNTMKLPPAWGLATVSGRPPCPCAIAIATIWPSRPASLSGWFEAATDQDPVRLLRLRHASAVSMVREPIPK